jgi:hypothetical protein
MDIIIIIIKRVWEIQITIKKKKERKGVKVKKKKINY